MSFGLLHNTTVHVFHQLQACDDSCYVIYRWGYEPDRNQYHLDFAANLSQVIRYSAVTFCYCHLILQWIIVKLPSSNSRPKKSTLRRNLWDQNQVNCLSFRINWRPSLAVPGGANLVAQYSFYPSQTELADADVLWILLSVCESEWRA
jgi:hypothetical protein